MLGVSVLVWRIGGIINADARDDRFESIVLPNATFSGFVILLLRPLGSGPLYLSIALHAEFEVWGGDQHAVIVGLRKGILVENREWFAL